MSTRYSLDADRLNRWLTLVANLAVVAGIFFLAFELRQNSIMQQRQMEMDQITVLMEPMLSSQELIRATMKVKAIDGLEPTVAAFMERYKLPEEEAIPYSRMVYYNWYRHNAYYSFYGPTDYLDTRIRGLWQYPDVRIAFELDEDDEYSSDFKDYVRSITADLEVE